MIELLPGYTIEGITTPHTPKKWNTMLLSEGEREVVCNPDLLKAVEQGDKAVPQPDHDDHFAIASLVASYNLNKLRSFCFDHYPNRYLKARGFLENQMQVVAARDQSTIHTTSNGQIEAYARALALLDQEFTVPSNTTLLIQEFSYWPFSVEDCLAIEDGLIDAMRRTFSVDGANILFLGAHGKTNKYQRLFNDQLRFYKSAVKANLALSLYLNSGGKLPTETEVNIEYDNEQASSLSQLEGDRDQLFSAALDHAIDTMFADGYAVEVFFETGTDAVIRQREAVDKESISSAEALKDAIRRARKYDEARARIVASQLDDIVRSYAPNHHEKLGIYIIACADADVLAPFVHPRLKPIMSSLPVLIDRNDQLSQLAYRLRKNYESITDREWQEAFATLDKAASHGTNNVIRKPLSQ